MIFRVTKKTTPEDLNNWLKSLPPSKIEHVKGKPFTASRFSGRLNKEIDGLKMQKKLRDEWK